MLMYALILQQNLRYIVYKLQYINRHILLNAPFLVINITKIRIDTNMSACIIDAQNSLLGAGTINIAAFN